MRRLLLLLITLIALTTITAAEQIVERQARTLPLDRIENALPEEIREFTGDISVTEPSSFLDVIRRLGENAAAEISGYFKAGLKTCTEVFLIVLLCGVLKIGDERRLSRAASFACAAAICLCFVGDLRAMLALGESTISHYETFTEALFPVLSAAAAGAGETATASALYAGTVFFFHLLIRAIRLLLIPLLYIYLALSAADTALEQSTLDGWKKLLGSAVKKGLRILLFTFTAFLTVSGVTGGAVDALTLKAAKLTISSTVPVVGGMVSDASESVIVGATMLKNAIGAYGMIAVLAIGALPLLRLGIQYLMLQATCALCAVTGEKRMTALVGDASSIMGFLFAMTCVCALMVFLSIICFMKGFVM